MSSRSHETQSPSRSSPNQTEREESSLDAGSLSYSPHTQVCRTTCSVRTRRPCPYGQEVVIRSHLEGQTGRWLLFGAGTTGKTPLVVASTV